MSVLSKADCERVEAAIHRAEEQSATELVVAVVPRSGDYWLGRVLVSAAWALGAAMALGYYSPDASLNLVLLVQILVAGATYALFTWAPLSRALISDRQAERWVEERAFALFSERGLHRTRDRTGMLILVSELEHRVVILGDSAIHERVGTEGWQRYVDTVVGGIREGKAAEALISVIDELGKVHGELLPVTGEDKNELPNEIVHYRR